MLLWKGMGGKVLFNTEFFFFGRASSSSWHIFKNSGDDVDHQHSKSPGDEVDLISAQRISSAQQITWWWSWSFITTASQKQSHYFCVQEVLRCDGLKLNAWQTSQRCFWSTANNSDTFFPSPFISTQPPPPPLLSLQHKTTNGQEVLFSKLNHLQICQFHSIQYSHLAY